MIICLADRSEAERIAEIHQQEIKKGFLSSLKSSFLTKIYSAVIESKSSFCIVAEENKEIIGFIAGTSDLDNFYFYFLKSYFFQAIFFLFPQIFNLDRIKKIIEILFYPRKEKKLPKAELLTIAVKSQFQGQGIATQMLKNFILEMKKRRVANFKVVVGEELSLAIGFYEKMGFKFYSSTTIHKNQPSRVYIYNIK
jgi:ribosomal protein S18 acetylase RimI-like enzyme